MSPSGNEALEKASDEQASASVFDFIYCDDRRIGAFLSQFDELGVPTRVSVSESVKKARGRAFKFSAGGGIPGIGNANLTVERGPAEIGGEKAEQRDYDPLWANALALLDYLETNDLVRRDITTARIGQIVLVTGSLNVLDLALFKGLWSLPAVREAAMANVPREQSMPEGGNRKERRASRVQAQPTRSTKTAEELAIDGGLALVGMLPHAVQARITTPSGDLVWSSLREQSLVISGADLFLKHGSSVSGTWAMLGVFDAFPDADSEGNLTTSGYESVLSAQAAADSAFGTLMCSAMPAIRPLLGRPFHAHGVTPLLIFREVSTD